MLLACVWKTFSNGGNRIIVPALLKYETRRERMAMLKETWLQECLQWFETKATRMGKRVASVIVYSGFSPIFAMFSNDCDESMKVINPKLTDYVCMKKAISALFPREALCSFL